MHIAVIIGTRPEVIKMCPVVHALRKREGMRVSLFLSGQHRELAREALAEFALSPDRDLDVMRTDQTPATLTVTLLSRFSGLLEAERPDLLLVHGDTTTAFAAALAAFYLGIPVGHVEAGLRTYCHVRPFPEEFNRRALAAMATYHFAPTAAARDHLLREGVAGDRVFCVGNTVVDALRYTVKQDYQSEAWQGSGRLVLFTAHRRELSRDELLGLYRAVARIAARFPDLAVLYPVHPRLRAMAEKALLGSRVRLLAPLSTVDCHNLMARATLLLTDSGGMQEEACALSLPTLVLRQESERGEGIAAGLLRLVGTEEGAVFSAACELLSSPAALSRMRGGKNPYGDGRAAERLADILCGVKET